MAVSDEEIRARVKNGIELLDAKLPGWREKVVGDEPLTGYQMQKAFGHVGKCGCVLARVTGNFFTSAGYLMGEDSSVNAWQYGFNVRHGDYDGIYGEEYDDKMREDYDQLAAAWRAELGLEEPVDAEA